MSDPDPAAPPFRIGVISDTHGELPDAVERAFAGVDAIVHAGDIGSGYALDLLEAIAPVTAVAGNMDVGRAAELPLAANVSLGGVRVLVAHRQRDLAGSLDPVRAGARVAVVGHTHVPMVEERDGVLWVNPGSPVAPRAGSAPSVAIVTIRPDGAVSAEIVALG
ncbi:MAG TPA: metallophosphoesterase family protein [Coriobacteriia bacterium]